MRGGIAERGGVRVGHRIIEINGQSVVATPHEKIVQILSNAMGELTVVEIVHISGVTAEGKSSHFRPSVNVTF
ncbi:Amyloid-beta A4 precursor protein-binding A member 1 [Xenoophorus captivus]|uniref:Amyloid-beta A4 protein-binding A member 1 n=1 Tax=Xenoophorus captivus TaxID=1517983 RepID=A0ABV0QR69_9TELE